VVMAPDQRPNDSATLSRIDGFIQQHGSGSRTYKSALIFILAASDTLLREEARKLLAWEAIQYDDIMREDAQKAQIKTGLASAQTALRDAVWRTYRHIGLLNKQQGLDIRELPPAHASSASSLTQFVVNQLKLTDDLQTDALSPRVITRNWPAMTEWSTKAVRDACFASPVFPRLLNGNSLKETIARGVSDGMLAYVGHGTNNTYDPFLYKQSLSTTQVDLADDVFIITRDAAEQYLQKQAQPQPGLGGITELLPEEGTSDPDVSVGGNSRQSSDPTGGEQKDASQDSPQTGGRPAPGTKKLRRASWRGTVPGRKWTLFYSRVLTPFAQIDGVTITVQIEIAPGAGIDPHQVEDMKTGLRDLGLDDTIETE